ncbi:YjfI family protein [Catenovulum sp. 2E275]|uniref:YjfI family protein n=1 Tax=Catenovulum sp. 2E275 TaxID=2980497 RepID=UPI0021D28956|nr:YjfI family protein [Catenovulum sp. 2E275]MCU4675161.1 YjfI family protein [Catenovulum sp. 2E275]
MNIHKIAQYLNDLGDGSVTGHSFDCQPIAGEVDVLQISIIGREELPIFVSVTDDQILCITYLWDESEIVTDKRLAMMETMLEMNMPMPLSSFAKIDDKYAVFGALAITSSLAEIEHELAVLSDNAIDVIDDFSEFLV